MTAGFMFAALVAGLIVVAASAQRAERRKALERQAFVERYDFGMDLDRRLRDRLPFLSDANRSKVWAGLRAFFRMVLAAKGQPVAMPSRAVDEAWHLFLCDTRHYRDFCERAFGRFVDHTPDPSDPNERQRLRIADMRRRTVQLATSLGVADLLTLDVELGLPSALPFVARSESDDAGCGGVSIIASSCSTDGPSDGCGSDGGGGCGGD